jgi:hypothetical protein
MDVLNMDVAAIAAAAVAAKAAEMQMAVAAKMLRMNADAASQVVNLIEAAQQNLDKLADVPAGIGQNLDLSV